MQHYSSVHVLMLYWENGREVFKDQVRELAVEFRRFNYHVNTWHIPSARPWRSLSKRLLDFLKTDQRARLLIIYYGGHGQNNEDKHNVWLW